LEDAEDAIATATADAAQYQAHAAVMLDQRNDFEARAAAAKAKLAAVAALIQEMKQERHNGRIAAVDMVRWDTALDRLEVWLASLDNGGNNDR
jgi:hypothetical protein